MLRRSCLRAPFTARFALPLALAALAAPAARAQQPDAEIPRPSRTYALTNARVVVAPGRVLERATVVVRDGLIAEVGANARIPFDAQRIAADSMTVYAGFVDALGQVGFARPETPQNLPRVPNPDQPPRDRAGLEPDRRASQLLKVDDASIDAHRKAGFGAVHSVPYGGFLPGQGALLLLSGAAPESFVLRDQASLFATFQTARGVYPATPMAIMAEWRTLARETARRGTQRDAYARQSAGRERPAFDPVTDALVPVVNGTRPVFFHARSVLEAHRALRLKDDLGLRLVLAGVPDAADIVDALQAARVPFLLTLDLPKEPAAARADSSRRDTTAQVPVDRYNPGFQIGNFANLAGERSNLESRARATATAYTEAAGRLDRAGVAFAFTTIGMKAADVQKNVRRMIGAGLTEDAALAALTTRPAEILGASAQLGTVERGKIANLVVTRGSYFAPTGAIRMVFVDGTPYRYEAPAATSARRAGANGGAASTSTAARATGAWAYEVESPQGTVTGTITITGGEGALAGTISSEALGGSIALTDVSLSGNALSFAFTAPQFGALSATVTIDGDSFSGTLTVPGAGAVPITGTRRPN